MKKFVINGKFLSQRVTGVQRFAREICAELDKIIQHGEIEMAVPKNCGELPDYKNIKIVETGIYTGVLWEQISLPRYAHKKKAVIVNLCNASPLAAPGVVCIHDVKIKAAPQYFSKKFLAWYNLLFNRAIKKAAAIVTVSEFSKSEICKYYDIGADKISVVYNAWQHYNRVKRGYGALEKYSLEEGKYYFAMGSLEPNKNFKWIAERAKADGGEIYAVAGSVNEAVFKDGFGFDCPPNMRLLGYVEDSEAKELMGGCKAFLFPSFYEGFGIPPLEALSAGARQIVVSDIPVMHEVFGSAATYIDPCDYSSGFESAEAVSADGVLNAYGWDISAKKLLGVLSSLK